MTKIFILHGWTYQTETWRPLVRMLKERGLDVELLETPGLTDDTNPPPAGGWTLDDYVAWLKQKTSACDTVILYGHSNGGRISLAFAARYPEKVARLILEDSAGIPPRGLRKLKRDIFKKISQAGHMFTRSETIRNLLYRVIRENDYRAATPQMKKTMSNLVAVDLSPILDRIQAPTLIIWGAKDATTPLADGTLIHKGIRGSRMHIIPDARHSPHITHTKDVADLITEELSAQGGSAFGGKNQ